MHKTSQFVPRIVRVDLTAKAISQAFEERYAGWMRGRALASAISTHENIDSPSALDPSTRLVFSPGILAGYPVHPSCRTTVTTINAFNNGTCFSSVGGGLADCLAGAGIDALVIQGQSSEPVCLCIQKGTVKIESCPELWGGSVSETDRRLKASHGGTVSVACIGEAGENECLQAGIIVDRFHAAAWGGCGAVMGSKRLKAIVGEMGIWHEPTNPAAFQGSIVRLQESLHRSSSVSRLRAGGTHGAGDGGDHGIVPWSVRNFQDDYWPPEKTLAIRDRVFRERWEVGRTGCPHCPIACLHLYKHPAWGLMEGVHANTARGFGPNLDIADPETVLLGQYLCSELGMNIDSVANSLGWLYEARESGAISAAELEGTDPIWGRSEPIGDLITQMARRSGPGALLSDGTMIAARRLGRGSEAFAVCVKGVGINERAMRSHKGWALGISTSTRGGGHLGGAPQSEFSGVDPETALATWGIREASNPIAYEGKGKLVAWYDWFKAFVDTTGLCYMAVRWGDPVLPGLELIASIVESVLGLEFSADDALTLGRRVLDIEKAFNTVRSGFTRQDDIPPARLFDIPVSGGPFAGERLDRDAWDKQLSEYYLANRWDTYAGSQRTDTLRSMGLHGPAGWLAR